MLVSCVFMHTHGRVCEQCMYTDSLGSKNGKETGDEFVINTSVRMMIFSPKTRLYVVFMYLSCTCMQISACMREQCMYSDYFGSEKGKETGKGSAMSKQVLILHLSK